MLNNIALIVHPSNKDAALLAKKIIKLYQNKTRKLKIIDINLKSQSKNFDLGLVIGGDGTMIRACRFFWNTNVPLIGVNHGRLGFLVDISDSQIEVVLPDIFRGGFTTHQRNMIEATIIDDSKPNKPIKKLSAVNDFYLIKPENASIIDINIWDNKDFLISMRADGIIIATPTGSTAYALSNGGPIMHPQVQGFVFCAVAPHSLTNRPIVLPDNFELKIKLAKNHLKATANLCDDGQSFTKIDINSTVKINKSQYTYTLAHPINYNYYQNLRNKLFWNE